ncbi:MAG: hypothetical protein WC584_03065 [Candidatus Pacearchaeota archaeon]
MDRKIDDKTILDKFAEEFCAIVEKYAKYIVCSGFVAIAHGRTRGTEDIDMIVEKISEKNFVVLHKDLINHGFVCIQSDNSKEIYNNYLKNKMSVRYVLKSEGYFPSEMEIKFSKDLLDEEQLKERVKFPLTGLDIYFSSIESNIAFKEELLKSDKDMEDARHLRIIYESEFDEEKINKIKKKIKELRL